MSRLQAIQIHITNINTKSSRAVNVEHSFGNGNGHVDIADHAKRARVDIYDDPQKKKLPVFVTRRNRHVDMGVSNKSVSWTSTFVMKILQENRRRSDVTFLVQTFWTPPYISPSVLVRGEYRT